MISSHALRIRLALALSNFLHFSLALAAAHLVAATAYINLNDTISLPILKLAKLLCVCAPQ
jgi:hypothetical protein